jgi:23S rRNA (cytidine1920-2'-O)/16S rRNA (cytidine1409-2'-O)-methyltransferase
MQKRSRRSLIDKSEEYASRSAYKLDSCAGVLGINFQDKIVLDVGSSTGGFTDYALKHGASKVVAVEKGTEQLSRLLRGNPKIELHEKTDINKFTHRGKINIVLIDVSFVSLKDVLPSVVSLVGSDCEIIAMVKPQFENTKESEKHNGVIKNERIRRQILASLETWLKERFIIEAKADSKISGVKGNVERFYKLKPVKKTA